jgi:hypothetical protein
MKDTGHEFNERQMALVSEWLKTPDESNSVAKPAPAGSGPGNRN